MASHLAAPAPLHLEDFAGARLPLGTPVIYAGLSCRITGRAFGRAPNYDLETTSRGHRLIFPSIGPEAFTIDFARLSGAQPCLL